VPDRLRGRVFALSSTAQAITTSLSSYWIGVAADNMGHDESPRHLALVMAGLMVPSGVLMLLTLGWRKPEPVQEAATVD